MRNIFWSLLLSGSGLVLMALPLQSQAFEASLISISPAATDISSFLTPPTGGDAEVLLFGWVTEVGQDYTVEWSVDQPPGMVVIPGGDLDNADPASALIYDADAGILTVTFTATAMDTEAGQATIIALAGTVAPGEDGPPAEMIGGWLTTDNMNWQLIPPSENRVAFGYEFTGEIGTTAYAHMFMPQLLVDLLSTFSEELTGEELNGEDLAVMNDGAQSSLNIVEVDGGWFVDVNVTFIDGNTVSSLNPATETVTKSVTVEEKLPLSLAATKSSVKKNKKTRLYGWLKSGETKQKVRFFRKASGEDEYTKWKVTKTKADGYFAKTITVKKGFSYQAKVGKGGSAKTSPEIEVSLSN